MATAQCAMAPWAHQQHRSCAARLAQMQKEKRKTGNGRKDSHGSNTNSLCGNIHTHSIELMLQKTCRCIPSLIGTMQLLLDVYIAGEASACREQRAGVFFLPQSSLVHREIPRQYNVAQEIRAEPGRWTLMDDIFVKLSGLRPMSHRISRSADTTITNTLRGQGACTARI
jgi:hypothetical protein